MFSVRSETQKRGKHPYALIASAVLAISVAMSGSAMAQSMVVKSSGPSAAQYPTGKKLAANTKVTLQANDQLTVLDKSGTRVLKGPGTYSLDGAVRRDQSSSTQLANLLATGSNARRSRTGAVRGTPTKLDGPRSPNLWFLDVSQAGPFCVAEPARLLLWRADGSTDAVARLSGPSGATAALDWKRGSQNKLWPLAEVPIQSGSSYRVTGPDGQSRSVKMVVLSAVPEAVDEVASLLIENGCENQLGLLVETMAAVSGEDEPAEG